MINPLPAGGHSERAKRDTACRVHVHDVCDASEQDRLRGGEAHVRLSRRQRVYFSGVAFEIRVPGSTSSSPTLDVGGSS